MKDWVNHGNKWMELDNPNWKNKEFIQEDESREEVREKKKHKNHKGRDDR